MKPSTLRPGDRVRRRGSPVVLRFVSRDAQRRLCVFRAKQYEGQYGPEDAGLCVATDFDVSRHFEAVNRVENQGRPGMAGY
jgi:hypothetical protein